MRIYFLERTEYKGALDEMINCVAIAKSTESARMVAAGSSMDEGRQPWLSETTSTCVCIGTAAKGEKTSRLVCRDKRGF